MFERKGIFVFDSTKLKYPSVSEWLFCLGYEEYAQQFEDTGFDSMEYLILQTSFKEKLLDEFTLRDEVGVDNLAVRRDILKRLKKSKLEK